MNVEIIESPLRLDLYGFSGFATDKDYAGLAFRLMDKMWNIVRTNKIQNKGKNIWVYEPGDAVFAGVEADIIHGEQSGIEIKSIHLEKYAYVKHIGPYQLIKHTGQAMTEHLRERGFETELPYLEIYGHWTEDESRLETELLMKIK